MQLKHLAIIMDGNGRWATSQGKKRVEGHKVGANVVREITQWCAKSKIQTLTLYAFSTENWKRPKYEVEFLMKMLQNYLEKELPTYQTNNIRFFAIGDLGAFSQSLRDKILEVQEKTKHNTALNQVLALNYGGKNEILRAFKKIQSSNFENLTQMQDALETHLDTAIFGDVDMLIRTGGETRLSNFLLWQSAYAELFFTPTLWPDFQTLELEAMIQEFHQRHRRFGGL